MQIQLEEQQVRANSRIHVLPLLCASHKTAMLHFMQQHPLYVTTLCYHFTSARTVTCHAAPSLTPTSSTVRPTAAQVYAHAVMIEELGIVWAANPLKYTCNVTGPPVSHAAGHAAFSTCLWSNLPPTASSRGLHNQQALQFLLMMRRRSNGSMA
jgi:hypothetical protein